MALQSLFSAGLFPIKTLGEPGAQGADISGIQGIGVSTPNAAAVAAATVGFAMELHMPKGWMFFIGTKSTIVAAGFPSANVRFSGVTMSGVGTAPKLQAHMAPRHT